MPFDIPVFSDRVLINLFLKSFAVLGAVVFLIYAIVLVKQTLLMLQTVKVPRGSIFILISFGHIIAGVILLVLAITLL